MPRTHLWFFCLLVLATAGGISAQEVPSIAGGWISTTTMPSEKVTEHWTFRQQGKTISGTLKSAQGDWPVAGTIDESGFVRVDVKVGDLLYKVRATVDKTSGKTMDGSIAIGSKEYLWSAKVSEGTQGT